MAGAERGVSTLGPPGEAGEPVLLPQGADASAAAGQHFVRIGLVADVPDDAVVRSREYGVQRYGQFDDTEAGAEVSAGDRHRVDDLGTQLVGELAQLVARQLLERLGSVDGIQ